MLAEIGSLEVGVEEIWESEAKSTGVVVSAKFLTKEKTIFV